MTLDCGKQKERKKKRNRRERTKRINGKVESIRGRVLSSLQPSGHPPDAPLWTTATWLFPTASIHFQMPQSLSSSCAFVSSGSRPRLQPAAGAGHWAVLQAPWTLGKSDSSQGWGPGSAE